jgi:hypothetical protein
MKALDKNMLEFGCGRWANRYEEEGGLTVRA